MRWAVAGYQNGPFDGCGKRTLSLADLPGGSLVESAGQGLKIPESVANANKANQ